MKHSTGYHTHNATNRTFSHYYRLSSQGYNCFHSTLNFRNIVETCFPFSTSCLSFSSCFSFWFNSIRALNVGTMSVPRKTPCPTQKGCKRGYFVFHRKGLEPRVLPWQQYSRCHFVSFVMYISGAKYEDHCSNISGDILNSVFYRFSGTIYDIITSLICIIQIREYL